MNAEEPTHGGPAEPDGAKGPAARPAGPAGPEHPAGPGPGGVAADARTPDEVLDCLGRRCPLPVIALAKRLPRLPVGAVLRVLADDPAAGNDIAAWCRLRGQEHLGSPAPHIHDVRRLH